MQTFSFFFDFTPPKHLTTGDASICGPGVKRGMYDFHSTARLIGESKASVKIGRGICSLRGEEEKKKKKSHRANSSDPSAKSHKLLAVHTVRAPMYTQANTGTHIQIQDVGSQFSKHSSYPVLL